MRVAVLKLDLYLPGINSLKEKRKLLQSLMDKIDNDFNVAISEVENQDLWQRSVVAAVSVSNESSQLESMFAAITNRVDKTHGIELIEREVRFY